MAISSRKGILLAALLSSCSGTSISSADAEKQNESSFAKLLKKKDMEKASRFALYFQSKEPSDSQARLMAQYALQSCQPKMALEYIAHLPEGREKDLFRGSTLALTSVSRPWEKPLLAEKELAAPEKGQPEELKQEVWADEWSKMEFRVQACRFFPLHPEVSEREAMAKEAEELFLRSARVKPFSSLTLLGLAMDVNYRPDASELSVYLSRFSHQRNHPYYKRLQFWADAQAKIPAKFQPVRQAGGKVALGELNLAVDEFRPHEVEIPWLISEEKP